MNKQPLFKCPRCKLKFDIVAEDAVPEITIYISGPAGSGKDLLATKIADSVQGFVFYDKRQSKVEPLELIMNARVAE